jgi:hypothetical protein
MKITLLKNLIKEAVREVIKEELLQSNFSTHPPSVSRKNIDSSITTKQVLQNPTVVGIDDILRETRNSMTNEEYKTLVDIGTGLVTEERSDFINQEDDPGLDLSNLGFVKKAADVLALAEQKTKKRTY